MGILLIWGIANANANLKISVWTDPKAWLNSYLFSENQLGKKKETSSYMYIWIFFPQVFVQFV